MNSALQLYKQTAAFEQAARFLLPMPGPPLGTLSLAPAQERQLGCNRRELSVLLLIYVDKFLCVAGFEHEEQLS